MFPVCFPELLQRKWRSFLFQDFAIAGYLDILYYVFTFEMQV